MSHPRTTAAAHLPDPQRLDALVMNGSGHAFDGRTGRSYTLNATGQVALLMLRDGADGDAVTAALIALCGQPAAVVEAGVDAFLAQLERIAA